MTTTKVNSEFIAVNAISGTIIADGAITSTHLAANCVDSSELVTGSIDTIHIAANQVTATKIVTNGVLTRHISDDQITADKLANSINTDIATGVTGNTTANAALPKAGGTMTGDLILGDSVQIEFGAASGGDANIRHDGSNTKFSQTGSGGLYIGADLFAIQNGSHNENYLTASANGAVSLYYDNAVKLATTSTGIDVTGTVTNDGLTVDGTAKSYTWRAVGNSASSGDRWVKIARIYGVQSTRVSIDLVGRAGYGDGNKPSYARVIGQLNNDNNFDFSVQTTGTAFGEIGQVDVSTSETDIYVKISSFAELSAHAVISSGTVTPTTGNSGASQGVGSEPTGYVAFTESLILLDDGMVDINNVSFPDNGKALFGAGDDLQIYHDGSNSYIKENGTGALVVQSNGTAIVLEKTDGENMILANVDGDVKLYYNGSEKLATTSTGIDVTGTATMDGLTVNSGATDQVALFESTDQFADLALKDSGGTSYIRQSNGSLILEADRANASSNSVAIIKVDNSEKMRLDSTGVGIGTTSPQKLLHVADLSGSAQIMISSSDSGVASLQFSDAVGGSVARGYIGYDNSTNHLALGTGAAERMRIDSSGNVGIGTTSPTQKLDVNGTVELNNLTVAGAQGSDGQVLTSTGSGVAWEAAATTFASLSDATVSTSHPAVNTNPSTGVGTLWLNKSAGELYVCTDATSNANIWLNIGDGEDQVGGAPSGGTESTAGGYTYHAFTSSGTLTVPAAKTGVDVLIVAGGGGGGGRYNSGGGGAGGMLEYTNQTFNGNHTVTVGSGGAGGAHDSRGTQGGSSSISGPSGSWTTAVGGGGGGGWNNNGEGGDGGSGGGASGYQTGNTSQGNGTSGQGTSGGRGASYGAGGGGGKTATSNPTGGGQNGTNTQGGDGGPGKQWLNGTTYAGGGGGSDYGTSGGQGVGGTGGGGTGGSHGNGNINGAGTLEATDATANTGGGGGGASGYGAANDTSPMAIGGNGGSGIVIFRYAT